ncbi:MAG: diaminopropionate ammonia-lyase, partial [Amylibacter sp.]
IHRDVSEGRAQAMRDLGATVTRIDGDYDASVGQIRDDADANGWFIVSDTSWAGYTQPPTDVMAGYGVMVREIVQALDTPPTHVFLQGGVGGLAAGVVAGFRQHWGEQAPRVVVVEPELAACLFESAKVGAATNVIIEEETLMAGLSCGEPSPLAWAILREEATDFLTIPEKIVAPAMRLASRPMGDDPSIVAGESAVAGFAAVIACASQDGLRDVLGLSDSSRVLVIGSEGATDLEIYEQLMAG